MIPQNIFAQRMQPPQPFNGGMPQSGFGVAPAQPSPMPYRPQPPVATGGPMYPPQAPVVGSPMQPVANPAAMQPDPRLAIQNALRQRLGIQ